MALTLNTILVPFRDKLMNRLVRFCNLTGPASYTTGGVAIDNLNDFGWGQTESLSVILTNGTNIYLGVFDRTNQKIMFWVPNTNVEVANAVDLSGFTGHLIAWGQ